MSFESDWISYHLFYHGDRDRILSEFMAPLLSRLWKEDQIGSFFFVRYGLGGPHVRIRIKASFGRVGRVAATVEDTAAVFLNNHPSIESMDEERVLRESRILFAMDPEEDGRVQVYPNNSGLLFPVRFEVERYGGTEFFPSSLDFFAMSSVTALEFLTPSQVESRGRRLLGIFRLLARQAFGFATGEEELLTLFGYALAFWPSLSHFAGRGDEVFDARREQFCEILVTEVESATHDPFPLTDFARRLQQEIARADPQVRQRILLSQMHMTANRLGLLNPEEVYLGRLLTRSALALAEAEPARWRGLCESLGRKAQTDEGPRLSDLLPAAFADLFASHTFSADGDPTPCSNPG